MKKKIIGILVAMLFIATVVPAVGNTDEKVSSRTNILVYNRTDSFVPGMFIVKLTDESAISSPSITALNEKNQVISVEKVFKNSENTRLDHIYELSLPEDSNILSIVEDYSSNQYVVYAEPNYIGNLCIVPNDENFEVQWALNNSGQFGGTPDADIDAVEAWDIETGSPDVVIASIDTGVYYTNPDLADNIWINIDEIPDNGIDDDENGYVDDVRGWDFCENDNDPLDTYSHGTMCAGIHGMVTDNDFGGAGVCWDCKTMVVRTHTGTFTQEKWYANGIKYAADNNAEIINIEILYYSYPFVIEDAVDYAYEKGCFLCAPAGNDNIGNPCYPAAFENVTGVAATNQRDERCDEDDWGEGKGSNYGDWVDVAAPGNKIFTTIYGGYSTSEGGGTSLAAPHVAGLAALLLSADPTLSPDEMKEIICDEDNVDPYESTEYIGSGRINAYKALLPFIETDLVCSGNLKWLDVKPGLIVTGNFTVENVGDFDSLLDWGIVRYPEWGNWMFDPESGENLTPDDEPVTVEVTCVAPDKKNTRFSGNIKIVNLENPNDICYIDVLLNTPKNKPYNFNLNFLSLLFERFPNAFPILRHITGLY